MEDCCVTAMKWIWRSLWLVWTVIACGVVLNFEESGELYSIKNYESEQSFILADNVLYGLIVVCMGLVLWALEHAWRRT